MILTALVKINVLARNAANPKKLGDTLRKFNYG
ncbi:hypothetical protein Flavo103_39210 [Flavobacterium collinsii]|nr:hypothetical protein Flavo103_39210 [Flavobacterium collinsii]